MFVFRAKMIYLSSQNDLCLVPKCFMYRPKMIACSSQNDLWFVPKWFVVRPEMIYVSSQNDLFVVPQWFVFSFQNDLCLVSKWLLRTWSHDSCFSASEMLFTRSKKSPWAGTRSKKKKFLNFFLLRRWFFLIRKGRVNFLSGLRFALVWFSCWRRASFTIEVHCLRRHSCSTRLSSNFF